MAFEPKVTDVTSYFANLLVMLQVATMLQRWDRASGAELASNLEGDPAIDKAKRSALAAFVAALNQAAAHAEKLDALDAAFHSLLRRAREGKVGQC